MKKLLFICTSNVKRSITAEALFSVCSEFETKSAGTHASSGRSKVTQDSVNWAGMIFVMSEAKEKQLSYVKDNFVVGKTPIYDLEISDIYYTHQKELKEVLVRKVSKYLDLKPCLDNLLDSINS